MSAIVSKFDELVANARDELHKLETEVVQSALVQKVESFFSDLFGSNEIDSVTHVNAITGAVPSVSTAQVADPVAAQDAPVDPVPAPSAPSDQAPVVQATQAVDKSQDDQGPAADAASSDKADSKAEDTEGK